MCYSEQTGCNMKSKSYTAVVKQEGESWIGCIEDVPGGNGQDATREELEIAV